MGFVISGVVKIARARGVYRENNVHQSSKLKGERGGRRTQERNQKRKHEPSQGKGKHSDNDNMEEKSELYRLLKSSGVALG
jgi:hypothetical protein